MVVTIHWIMHPSPSRLGIMARPRGGEWLEDEIRSLASTGVEVLVSLLTDAEMWELGLVEEGNSCAQHHITFLSFPIPDRQPPPLNDTTVRMFQQLAQLVAMHKTIVIHCRMGIGRAAVVAATTLALGGMPVAAAFDAIAVARGCAVPDTPEQRAWVEAFCRHRAAHADSSIVWPLGDGAIEAGRNRDHDSEDADPALAASDGRSDHA